MRRLLAPALFVGLVTGPALAQETPKPGAEHARIGYFAGTWQFEAEAQASPMGPGGKVTGTDVCEWFEGGLHLTCRGDLTGPRGPAKTGSIWGYDPMQQAYTYYAYNSLGEAFHILGKVADKVWTWTADFPVGPGATMKIRATITEQPPTAYTYRIESSADGTSWTLLEEGRATKRTR